MYEDSNFSTFLPILSIVCLFYHNHVDVKWNLTVLLIFLMAKDVKHLFICLLAICLSPMEKSLLKFFANF